MSKYAEVLSNEYVPELPIVEFTYAEVAEMVVIVDAVSELVGDFPEFSTLVEKCRKTVTMGDVNFAVVKSNDDNEE